MRKILFLTVIFIGVALVSSCLWESSYPSELIQADSMLMKGYYQKTDSLLALYDKTNQNGHEVFQHYRELLRMGRKFADEELTDSDFSIVDSLCRYYYDYNIQDKYGKALCFLGEIYRVSGDYPSALNTFMKATQVAERCGDDYLMVWLSQRKGDIYFNQRMLEDCISHYRRYYALSVSHKDTLRMALAAFRMGKVFTIRNEVDSIIAYYKKSIELGKHTSHPGNIVPYALFSLSDIYIQTEEFEKAEAIMPHDDHNDMNWAYWHLGQNHVDSAIYYFERLGTRYGYGAHEVTIRYLAQLEERRGNIQKALSYYRVLPAITDTLRQQSQVIETKKVYAQYNQNLIREERDKTIQQNNVLKYSLLIVLLIVLFGFILGYYVWNYYRQKKDNEIIHERLLRKEKEAQFRHSEDQIKKNNETIATLKKQLAEARQTNDTHFIEKLQLDTELLTIENQNIKKAQQRQNYLLAEFKMSPLYQQITQQTVNKPYHPSEKEWKELADRIDDIYPDFTQRLYALAILSDLELKTCYLIKIGISPRTISSMLYKSKTAISMIRLRLYKKITHQEGTTKQFDEFIINF